MSSLVIYSFVRNRALNRCILSKYSRPKHIRLFAANGEDEIKKKQELKKQRQERRGEMKARFLKSFKELKQKTKQRVEAIIEKENIWRSQMSFV